MPPHNKDFKQTHKVLYFKNGKLRVGYTVAVTDDHAVQQFTDGVSTGIYAQRLD